MCLGDSPRADYPLFFFSSSHWESSSISCSVRSLLSYRVLTRLIKEFLCSFFDEVLGLVLHVLLTFYLRIVDSFSSAFFRGEKTSVDQSGKQGQQSGDIPVLFVADYLHYIIGRHWWCVVPDCLITSSSASGNLLILSNICSPASVCMVLQTNFRFIHIYNYYQCNSHCQWIF